MYTKLTNFVVSVFYIVGHKFTTFDKHTSLLRNLYIKTRNFLWYMPLGTSKKEGCMFLLPRACTIKLFTEFMDFCNKLECVYLASLV
jgi:hypothetical protein